jgi:hypothetical protein
MLLDGSLGEKEMPLDAEYRSRDDCMSQAAMA